jgi:RNA polymerase sigma-70 factor (ECF subfamily)
MKAIKIGDYRDYKLSDSDVVNRVISGEKELYEILLRRNNQTLYRVIRSYLKEQEDIEDIMQNTYLKAYEKLYQFKHNSKFSTWLIRIGINEALARLKTKGKYFTLHNSNDNSINDRILEIPDSSQIDPEKKIINQEAKLMLENAIDKLDVKYKNVYILREIEGMSIAEVSDCLKLSNSNVKVRLHRAKAKIKENLYESTSKKELFEFGLSKCDALVEKVMKAIM